MRTVRKVSHIGELAVDILGSQIIVKEMFFDAIEGEALQTCQSKVKTQSEHITHALRMHDALRCTSGPGREHDNKWGMEGQLLELQLRTGATA